MYCGWRSPIASSVVQEQPMEEKFNGIDLSNFWKDSAYALKQYVDDPLTAEKVTLVERSLGYKLPAAYIALARRQNGGMPKNTNHRTQERTSWAADHIAITGIYSIGSSRRYSLLGEAGSHFWIEAWGYPPIGVYFADCPSAGHDMICLDYRDYGADGEPRVVHIDQERDYKVTFVAESFEAFICGLQGDDAFDLEA
jgi:hypothetical protein